MKSINLNKFLFTVCLVVANAMGASSQESFFSRNGFLSLDGHENHLRVEGRIARVLMATPEGYSCVDSFSQEDVRYSVDGYARTTLCDEEFVLVIGASFVYIEGSQYNMYLDENPWLNLVWDEGERRFIDVEDKNAGTVRHGVFGVFASSTFAETIRGERVVYHARGLFNRFFRAPFSYAWYGALSPWVEGEEGPGIGVTLDIEFDEPESHMVVVNGFVDPARKHLYKANSRVRTARITSLEPEDAFSFEYEFVDRVQFSYIPFPAAARRVQFEIVDTYPGERWQDTSITAILTNPNE